MSELEELIASIEALTTDDKILAEMNRLIDKFARDTDDTPEVLPAHLAKTPAPRVQG